MYPDLKIPEMSSASRVIRQDTECLDTMAHLVDGTLGKRNGNFSMKLVTCSIGLVGHLDRMNEDKLGKKILSGRIEGCQARVQPRRTFMDQCFDNGWQ